MAPVASEIYAAAGVESPRGVGSHGYTMGGLSCGAAARQDELRVHLRPLGAPASQGDGVILGIAALLDAFLVRLLLMPVLLRLAGPAAWYVPSWLGRILPDVRFDTARRRPHEAQHDLDGRSREAGTSGSTSWRMSRDPAVSEREQGSCELDSGIKG